MPASGAWCSGFHFLWISKDTEARPVAFTGSGRSEGDWGPICMQLSHHRMSLCNTCRHPLEIFQLRLVTSLFLIHDLFLLTKSTQVIYPKREGKVRI